VKDRFGVGGRLEDRAFRDQPLAQGQEVGQIAVVGQGDAARFQIGEHRLNVADETAAGGGIASVPDRGPARQARAEVTAAEGVAHVAHVPLGVETLTIECGDAAGFLAAVLEGVEAQGGDPGGLRDVPDTEHAALEARGVVVRVARRRGPTLVLLAHRERSGRSVSGSRAS